MNTLNGNFIERTISALNDATIDINIGGVPSTMNLVDFQSAIASSVEPINNDPAMTGTSAATTTTYMQYAINVVSEASASNYASRLPNPPTEGKSCTIINTSGYPIVIFPSMVGGSINDVVDGSATIPSDNTPYVFTCYENPAPGSWSVILAQTDLLFNTRVGLNCLTVNTTGTENVAIGVDCLSENTIGGYNAAIGRYSMENNTEGLMNTAIGRYSLHSNTTGGLNTAIGVNTLMGSTTTNGNTAIGANSLTNTTGSGNTGVGYNSLGNNISGQFNSSVGSSNLFLNTIGNKNSSIGFATVSGDFSGSVILGYYATATGNNQFVVGSTSEAAGAITTETITPTKTWTVKINGVDYKIPLNVV